MGSRDTLVESDGRSDIRAIRRPDGPGSRVGDVIAERYELCALLGYGASGSVYQAKDLDDGPTVAVKLLHKHLRTSDGHVARFTREIRALSQIAHSAVVRVLDAGEDADRTLYLVMELLEGHLLYDRIVLGLETREILEVGRQLLGALAVAHARGIVHRDIKPENLFLAKAPSDCIRVKVLDFGIAKLTRPDAGVSFQTLDGMILGTPDYMSPEVCRGLAVTEAADLWATAAVLYHAFAKTPPFGEEEHVGRLLLRIVKDRAPSLATHRPDLPKTIIDTIDRALDPTPDKRFQSASALATALASGAPIDDLDFED
jgi:serine/threonine-protein kinase